MVSSRDDSSVTREDRLARMFKVALQMANDSSVISALSEDQASRLTGLSVGRLRYWQKTQFFRPSFHNDPSERFGRLYSFRDIVSLRTIAILLNEHKIPLRRLRDTFMHLFQMDQQKWASETLYVLGKSVYFETPEGGDFQETTSPQMVLHHIPLRKVAAETAEAVTAAKERPKSSIGKIGKVRGVRGSRPVIGGTRIPAQTVADYYKDGATVDDIIEEYPRLTKEDVYSALRYFGIEAA